MKNNNIDINLNLSNIFSIGIIMLRILFLLEEN